MINKETKEPINILKAVNQQLKNLREQRHTENGEVFAMQAVMADVVMAIRVFGALKTQWADRLPYCSYLTENEWEEMAVEISRPSTDMTTRISGEIDEGVFEHYDEASREIHTYEVRLDFWERPLSTLLSPEYFVRLTDEMQRLHDEGYAVDTRRLDIVRRYATESFQLDEEEVIMHTDEARYKSLCMALQCLQDTLAALLTDIKEMLSRPSKEKLIAFYDALLTDYEQKFRAREQRDIWHRVRDAADLEEKAEIIQEMTDEAQRKLMESGFLNIKANGLPARKYATEEDRLQAAYASMMNADGTPNVRSLRKYIFYHRSELRPTQVKAWFCYNLFLKLAAEEMAYDQTDAKPASAPASQDTLDEMAEALKTLYLPRCYGLLADGRDAAWVNTFVDNLLKSKHGNALCADWQMDKKRPQVVALVLGLLMEADALKGSNAEVSRMYNKGNDDRTFAKYLSNGRRSAYADWAEGYDL